MSGHIRTPEEEDAILAAQRLKFPKWAKQEREAHDRVCEAMVTGDVKAGSQALADWIDARAAMVVFYDVYGNPPQPDPEK